VRLTCEHFKHLLQLAVLEQEAKSCKGLKSFKSQHQKLVYFMDRDFSVIKLSQVALTVCFQHTSCTVLTACILLT